MPPMEPAFWSAVSRYHSPQLPPLNPVSRSEFQEASKSNSPLIQNLRTHPSCRVFFIKGDLRKCFANLIRHTEVLLKKWIFWTENTTMFV